MKHGQQGSAILLSIFVLVMLAGLGSALLFLSQNEVSMARSTNGEKTAFHLAEAAIEAGRMELFNLNGSDSVSDDLVTAAGLDTAISLDVEAIRPVIDSNGVPTGFNGVGDDEPILDITALNSSEASGGFVAAFLTNDPAESITSTTDTNRRVMVTGVGVDSTGASEVVQAIVEPWRPLPSLPMSAMTMIGPPPAFDNGMSMAQQHYGADCPTGGGIPNLYVPIVGLTNDTAEGQVEADMNRPTKFDSGTLEGADTIANLNDPTDPAMAQSSLPPIDSAWTDCTNLKLLVDQLIADADYYCDTDSGTCTTPVGAAGQVVVIDGDAVAGAFDAGLLLVTGELTYDGMSHWDGIVLVIGEGSMFRNGGGNGHNSGAVIIANIDPSPSGTRADKSDWCNNGFEATSFNVTGNGTSTISYCSDDVELNNPVESYVVTDFLHR